MIYKFSYEVCTDDNKTLCAWTEESGDFWLAFTHWIRYVMHHSPQPKS